MPDVLDGNNEQITIQIHIRSVKMQVTWIFNGIITNLYYVVRVNPFTLLISMFLVKVLTVSVVQALSLNELDHPER